MRHQISGTRNGASWPPPGDEIDLPDAEAVKYCANGLAVPVGDHRGDVETTTTDDRVTETRSDDGESDVDALRAQAKAAGVKVDKRWGADRLREAIAGAGEG
jgi:hypothetical protein